MQQSISSFDLILIANSLIESHPSYQEGMRTEDVSQKDGVLIFKGPMFLDDKGMPTHQTTLVFNMFKYLAHELSPKFTLCPDQ